MARLKQHALIVLLFAALTVVITFPQVLHLDAVPYHSDPYFSMWRLGWVAHQIREQPSALFEANIFFPAPRTLAYSDAMLLPGVLMAPLFWLSVDPVRIYNLTLLGAMLLSGLATFWLARRLTGSPAAGLVAGVIYAFAPYRFDHYTHLELQLVFWIPIALVLLHQTIATPRLGLGLGLGLAMVAQLLSCVYVAVFFAAYCVVFVPVLMLCSGKRANTLSAAKPLALAAILTVVVALPYAQVYARASETVGTRTREDIAHYGASLTSFTAVPPMNRLYGSALSERSTDELFLFPGVVAVALALIGIVAPTSRLRFAYLAGLILAFELSRGLDGFLYGWLYAHVPPFRALRSPARVDILVNLSLAILSAYGLSWICQRLESPRSAVAAGVLLVALVFEYASAPALAAVTPPTLVDAWLSRQAPAVVVELPLASADTSEQSRDWIYMYQGLPHFQRMLNGYSGYPPASYYAMLETMRTFPDDRSLNFLRDQHVDYVVLRAGAYAPSRWSELSAQVQATAGLALVSGFPNGQHTELVYAVRR